ncbi:MULTISPECIES: DinB family protein [unclassified Paenibacillus]|uniref:DinB family protein n=1 Tax=unclassified Paenibacillus TaxID=185978 RepID=UPI001C11FF87|nr:MULTISPECIES: DinB family protein [unclassified Paenibacillus]MBU5441308.1 DinB family protein [Paenibacillus sp. MSJ-34]CAH0120874.1 hypothetical protein PAE9249_03398 [Paenibacillus sp. CECT 9249]
MNKIDVLLQEWDYCYVTEDWHPPLADALAGLTAEQADWRPQGEASNTIRENVSHLLFFKERLLRRLKGEDASRFDASTNDETFLNESQGWEETVANIERAHREIRDILANLTEADLDRPMPTLPIARQVASLVRHDAYHTGQIVQIRKLQGSWPARRSFE